MDKQIQKLIPDYKRIYSDILEQKFPHKEKECQAILMKINLLPIDVIKLNEIIFGVADKETEFFNQRHRSYCESSILTILKYQEEYKLNNSQLASHFKLSRNTIGKWKRKYDLISGNNKIL